jgi:hypothetical protein
MAKNGASIIAVKEILGHADIKNMFISANH